MTSREIRDEFLSRMRKTDQQASMCSILKERYHARALTLDIILLVGSSVGAVTRFASPAVFPWVAEDTFRLVAGVAATVLFVASVVSLRVGWKAKAEVYGGASREWAALKMQGRRIQASGLPDDATREWLHRYGFCGKGAAVPEDEFVVLKQRHLRKVALSKAVSERPFRSLWLLRIRYWLGSNFALFDGLLHDLPHATENADTAGHERTEVAE